MPFHSTEHILSRASPEQLDTLAISSACNSDYRFQDAGWAETPASVDHLLLDKVFHSALTRLMPSGTKPALGAIVASVYVCRVEERGNPRKVGAAKRAEWKRLAREDL